jgi:4-alpha-methyl-delta7-sterol-4alpha-methyl oxidase
MSFDQSWDSFLKSTGLSDKAIFIIGTWSVHIITFWAYNLFLWICYKYDLFPEQKIEKGVFPEKELVNENMWLLAKNHFLVQPIALLFAYSVFASFGLKVYSPLPSWQIVLRDFIVAIAINDTLFYWAHRLLHHKSIYKYIHKQHHRYKHSIGIASEFAHPFEDIVANILPTLLGCLLMGSHLYTLMLWLFIRLLETLDAHSGYSWKWSPFHFLPFQGGSERHYFHHSHNVGCYGSFTIFWDWITGKFYQFVIYLSLYYFLFSRN